MKKSKLLFFRVICFKLILFTLRFPFLCPKQKIFVKDDICSRQSFKKSYKSNSQLKKSKLLFLRVICFLLFPFLCPKLKSKLLFIAPLALCTVKEQIALSLSKKRALRKKNLWVNSQPWLWDNKKCPKETIMSQSRNNYLPITK